MKTTSKVLANKRKIDYRVFQQTNKGSISFGYTFFINKNSDINVFKEATSKLIDEIKITDFTKKGSNNFAKEYAIKLIELLKEKKFFNVFYERVYVFDYNFFRRKIKVKLDNKK